MKKNHVIGLLIGLAVVLAAVVAMIFYFEGQPPESPEKYSWVPPDITPGVALMNMPKLLDPETADMRAGETWEGYITLETKRNGPGMVHYAIPSRIESVYSDEELAWPKGLNISIEPSDFMAYPNETYNSTITIKTAPDLLQGEYVFRYHHLFEGVMEGGGSLTVVVS
ncbi:hypothetical protein [Methanogenium organophilum]|uniref:Uncharacterized protein n=1 Tax=Methanogenium organophilum TaxID=2199 RepID=A0A9X9S3T9_METOG|nr:hypothetical protein [Methanogenium organophilum]WAI01439.1 hypothetical protein OU421_00785 [Methanogenium organophilum]